MCSCSCVLFASVFYLFVYAPLFWYILIIYWLFILIMCIAENESEVLTMSCCYCSRWKFLHQLLWCLSQSLAVRYRLYFLLLVINNDDSRISGRYVSLMNRIHTNFLWRVRFAIQSSISACERIHGALSLTRCGPTAHSMGITNETWKKNSQNFSTVNTLVICIQNNNRKKNSLLPNYTWRKSRTRKKKQTNF